MVKNVDIKLIFKEVIGSNPELGLSEFMGMTKKPERTVAYWLSGDRTPDDISLYQILFALKLSKRKVPRNLYRYINRLMDIPKKWAKRNMSDNEKLEYIGEKIKQTGPGNEWKYLFKDELKSVSDLGKISGLSYHGALLRIKKSKAQPGDDVTDVFLRKKRTHRNKT